VSPSPAERRVSVLIVDDIPANLAVLVDELEHRGFNVAVAQDGEEALERAEYVQPALILLDVMLPGIDGFETCRRLKANPSTRDIPVIFMTALTDANDKVHGFVCGGVDYVTKPFQMNEVMARVKTHLELRATQRRLIEAQAELVAAARQAGMAEIATNVLHNVGNILNSVNVSADLVSATLRDSKAHGLSRAVQLMTEHADDLGDFLTVDERGKMVPGYLSELAQALAEEQHGMLDELRRLTRSIDHIKEVVATQQSYAVHSGMVEPTQICDLLEDALRLNAELLARSHVTVAREFAPVPVVPLDRARVLQILVNLIGNAGNAMAGRPAGSDRLTLRVAMASDAWLQVQVQDNGEGIPAQNLTRIFAHGFTTRQTGHGFGLHSCALAAAQMGGRLTAHSDGPGQGATFTLELPIESARGSAPASSLAQ